MKPLTEQDTLVLADFTNTTGDTLFDGALKTALTVALRQSPFLNVLPDSKAAKCLKLMALPPDTKLTPEVARALCQRAGGNAFVAGAIASLDSEYVLQLKAVNCQDGDVLAKTQVIASDKGKVVDALGHAASELRVALGESLNTVRRFDTPLSEATTPSLEALKAFTLGRNAVSAKGEAAALPYHLRAIELDPGFATAYRAAGADYDALGETGRAAEYYTKAFQVRERASEEERLLIAGIYYQGVSRSHFPSSLPRSRLIATHSAGSSSGQAQLGFVLSVTAFRDGDRRRDCGRGIDVKLLWENRQERSSISVRPLPSSAAPSALRR